MHEVHHHPVRPRVVLHQMQPLRGTPLDQRPPLLSRRLTPDHDTRTTELVRWLEHEQLPLSQHRRDQLRREESRPRQVVPYQLRVRRGQQRSVFPEPGEHQLVADQPRGRRGEQPRSTGLHRVLDRLQTHGRWHLGADEQPQDGLDPAVTAHQLVVLVQRQPVDRLDVHVVATCPAALDERLQQLDQLLRIVRLRVLAVGPEHHRQPGTVSEAEALANRGEPTIDRRARSLDR